MRKMQKYYYSTMALSQDVMQLHAVSLANQVLTCAALDKVAMDAIYSSRWKTMYHAEVFIGLDPEFMVKAHLLIPEGEENIMYSWMLNFQYMSDEYVRCTKTPNQSAAVTNQTFISSPIHSGFLLKTGR